MANEYDIIIIRNGLRSELTSTTLLKAEMGFTTDTNQLFIGTDEAIDEIVFDPFTNAQATVQSWLDDPLSGNPEPGLIIDEDLVIRNVVDANAVIAAMQASASFDAGLYARPRTNVEVITENSFNQMFADQHLSTFDSSTGRRSSLFNKFLDTTSGTFLSYDKNVCTTFFVDYSLKQTDGTITYVRVGSLKVINGVPQGIEKSKLTDDNTEIWDDDGDNIAQVDEFSNIVFMSAIDGDNIKINYTQDANFATDIFYTVKRWSM